MATQREDEEGDCGFLQSGGGPSYIKYVSCLPSSLTIMELSCTPGLTITLASFSQGGEGVDYHLHSCSPGTEHISTQ